MAHRLLAYRRAPRARQPERPRGGGRAHRAGPSRRSRPLKELSMALSIARISLGDVNIERTVRDALDTLGVPAGEEWLASVVTRAAGAAWDVVLEGPSRQKADHIDWEIVEHAGGARYRKLFHGKGEQ